MKKKSQRTSIERQRDKFWPVILRTVPPIVMTKEDAYKKVPFMKVTYIPATCPRDELGAQSGPQEK